MTIKETVKWFIEKTVEAKGGKPSDYFCGMTNNPERRRKEHGATELLARTKCGDKDCARELMWALVDADFDVDKDIMSGQDDSVYVYVYRKSTQTKQNLSRTVTIEFNQRWYSENRLNELPETNGIYCCYSCDVKKNGDSFQNCKPLYIGMTTDGFKNRVDGHKNKDHDKWKDNQKMGSDKQLVYAIAPFDEDILQTVEAALIRENGTPENTEYKNGYQGEYHSITVNCGGPLGGLKKSITATFVGLLK